MSTCCDVYHLQVSKSSPPPASAWSAGGSAVPLQLHGGRGIVEVKMHCSHNFYSLSLLQVYFDQVKHSVLLEANDGLQCS